MYRTRRPRRSRFSVTLANGKRNVVLAHSASAATDHYNRKAFTLDQRVVSVVKGDYRVMEHQADGGWRLDRAALREAIEFLGLTLPVTIKPTATRGGGGYGAHRLRARSGKFFRNPALDTAQGLGHHITVNNKLTPAKASETIWHELAHAMQAERLIAKMPAATEREQYIAWGRVDRGTAYERKPIEVEARSYEQHAAEIAPAV